MSQAEMIQTNTAAEFAGKPVVIIGGHLGTGPAVVKAFAAQQARIIIGVVAGVLVLVGGSVGATLFLTGFFDKKPAAEAGADHGGARRPRPDPGDGARQRRAHARADLRATSR